MAKTPDLADYAMRLHGYRAQLDATLIASEEPFVLRLREMVFANHGKELDASGLLNPSRVQKWLRARQSAQDSVTFLQRAQIFSSGSPSNVRPGISMPVKDPLKLVVDVYQRKGLEIEHVSITTISVDVEDELGFVKAAADALHRRFGWTEKSAAAWFLCGSPPFVPGISVAAEVDHQWRKSDGTPWWKRLVFDVPVDIPITSLTKWGELQGKRESAHRGKPIGERQLELAVYAAAMNDGRSSWDDVLKGWNAIAPRKWRYTREGARRHLAKDARETYAKLTGERLVWKRGGTNAEA